MQRVLLLLQPLVNLIGSVLTWHLVLCGAVYFDLSRSKEWSGKTSFHYAQLYRFSIIGRRVGGWLAGCSTSGWLVDNNDVVDDNNAMNDA